MCDSAGHIHGRVTIQKSFVGSGHYWLCEECGTMWHNEVPLLVLSPEKYK